MLRIMDIPHVTKCIQYAAKLDALHGNDKASTSLLHHLFRYSDDDTMLVIMRKEMQGEYNFYFTVARLKSGEVVPWYDGGIILHNDIWTINT